MGWVPLRLIVTQPLARSYGLGDTPPGHFFPDPTLALADLACARPPCVGNYQTFLPEALKMQTLLVDLILAAAVAAVFLIALTRPQKRDEKG